MPSTGTPALSASGSTCGAPGSYTLAGPPLRISPTGARFFSSDQGVVPDTSSQYTFASRTRRAISWLNCEPKSRTRIVCTFKGGIPPLSMAGRSPAIDPPPSPPFTSSCSRAWAAAAVMVSSALPHAYVLGLLEDLALRGDRRRDDHLHVLKLGDVVGAANAQRRSQRTCEVLRAVVDPRRTKQDLLQRRLRPDVDPRSAWQVGVGRRHAPVESLRGRFLGAGEWGADHHGVSARRERLAYVRADTHAAVGDHGHAHAAAAHVLISSRRDIGGGGDLGHSDAEHAASGAGCAGPDSNQDARNAGFHQLQRCLVVHAVADDDRDVAGADKLFEGQLVVKIGRA